MTTITTRTRAARQRTRAIGRATLAARSTGPMAYYPTRDQASVEALHLMRVR